MTMYGNFISVADDMNKIKLFLEKYLISGFGGVLTLIH